MASILGEIFDETVERGLVDGLSDTVLAAGGLGIKNVEFFNHVATKFLAWARNDPVKLAAIQKIFRWCARAGSAAAKVLIRRALKNIDPATRDGITEVVEDVIATIGRDGAQELTPGNIDTFLAESRNRFQARHTASPTSTPATAPAAANHGVPMSDTPKPLGPPADFNLAHFVSLLNAAGKRRWAIIGRTYLTAAAPGTDSPNERSPRVTLRAIKVAAWKDEASLVSILNDDEPTLVDDEVIEIFIFTAFQYVGDGEMPREDQLADIGDALVTGETGRKMREGVDKVVEAAAWATPRFAVFAAVVIVGSIVTSVMLVIISAVLGYHGLIEDGNIKITLSKLVQAAICGLLAAAALIPLDMVLTWIDDRWKQLVAVATGPFKWAGDIIKAYAAARGLLIPETTETGAAH